MTQERIYRLETNPADFSVLVSAMFTIAREMGANMERTARAPIYFSAHDFATTIVTLDFELLALAEYIPVLIGATPFSPVSTAMRSCRSNHRTALCTSSRPTPTHFPAPATDDLDALLMSAIEAAVPELEKRATGKKNTADFIALAREALR